MDSIHLYNSGVKGLRINMICAGDYFAVDFLQSFTSGALIKAFLEKLDSIGIGYTPSVPIRFETTKDKAYITAQNQAERYYKAAEGY